MKYTRICLVFAFVISSFVVAGQPGQEDVPSVVLPYANKIWSHNVIGGNFIDIHEAIEQLVCAQQGLQEIRELPNNRALMAFYEEVVRVKQARLDYLCENPGTPLPVNRNKARRIKNAYIIINVKKN